MNHGLPSGRPGVGLEVKVRPSWWARYEWVGVTSLVVGGLLLAVWGSSGSAWGRTSDGLELLYPHFPPAAAPGTSWQMMVARVLLPLVALYATVRFVVSFYSQRVRLLRLRRLDGHSVVCGLSDPGVRAALTMAAGGAQVVAIDGDGLSQATAAALESGITVLVADPSRPGVLAAAAVQRAARVVCALPDDDSNLHLALAVRSQAPRPSVFARIARPELVELAAAAQVECFDLNDIWARNLLEVGPLARPSPQSAPSLLVVGDGALARSLVLNAARLWHFFARERGSAERLRVTVAAPNAAATCAEIRAGQPAIDRTSSLTAADCDVTAPELKRVIREAAPDAVYYCLDEESLNLGLARRAAQDIASRDDVDVVVAVSGDPAIGGAPDAPAGQSAGITMVAPSHAVDGLRLERFGAREELARALHGVYVNAARGRAGHQRTAIVPFEQIDPADQDDNRDQADAISRQLGAVLWRTTPIGDWDELAEPPPADVEVMAQLEHLRWGTAHTNAGWRYGAQRDDAVRHHPDLVPWSLLSEEAREINRAFVRARPALLGGVGWALEADPVRETLAAAVHGHHRTEVTGAPAPAPRWASVPEQDRAASRALVASIPAALLGIDRQIVASRVPPEVLDAQQIEVLAEAAHASWIGHRASEGRDHGQHRHDGTRSHPDIVPWEALREPRREIDRVMMRAIPRMLAEVGLGIEPLDLRCWQRAGAPDAIPQPSPAPHPA